jgi:hypothetical protein
VTTCNIWEVIDAADGEVQRASFSHERAQAWMDIERQDSALDLAIRMHTLTDVEPQVAALGTSSIG